MKITIYILMFLILTACINHQYKGRDALPSDTAKTDTTKLVIKEKPKFQYTDRQLENYLDSIGRLAAAPMAEKVDYYVDSCFRNQQQMNKLIAKSDYALLKHSIKKDFLIDIPTARRIFGIIQPDSSSLINGKIFLTLISFESIKTDFNEYAICLGYPNAAWNCELYFFKRNRLIARHNIEHHYGLELKHYKDSDGKTVIYYKENFGTGTGIWQFNFYFYKYYDNKLIPILNELENGNLQSHWGARIYWLETFVVKTQPLTLKMQYYQELYDTTGNSYRIIDNSCLVEYSWDEKSRKMTGDYANSKINRYQILTYYLNDNELLFINAYYKTLKACLKKKHKRRLVLDYLNEIKNHFENK